MGISVSVRHTLIRLLIRSAFTGYQYCASLPGGIECVVWLAKLAWDYGKPFYQADVPNGFPAAEWEELLEAVEAVIPEFVPDCLRWAAEGFQTSSSNGGLMGQVVGGMAQGSPIIPVLFGALMVHKFTSSQKPPLFRVSGRRSCFG